MQGKDKKMLNNRSVQKKFVRQQDKRLLGWRLKKISTFNYGIFTVIES